jgi:sugar/nucleoside kinase (ribokinase family)
MFEMAELVSLNEDEAAVFGGSFDPGSPERLLEGCRESLTRRNPSIHIVITAGRNGAFAWDGCTWEHCPALPVEVAGTAGAGDALLGGILAGVAAGIPLTVSREKRSSLSDQPLSSALDLAVLLAAYSVTSPHTIHPHASLGALTAFAQRHGLKFDPLLSCHWSDPHE